jgi:putative peptide zinc metalloprotease protein
VTTLVDAPARVDGVELVGEMVGSGYRNPPSLVRRSDGQVIQLTPLLYRVLAAVDGRRSCAEIADVVGRGMGRKVTEGDVTTLVNNHLRQLGLLKRADGLEPQLRRANPLLSLKPRFAVTAPRTTRWLTDPFRVLFWPVIVAAVVIGFVAVVAWVFFERGLGASAYDAFERPHLLLLVFAVSLLSGGFHEFGHAAAARYGGAQPGPMGVGLYLVWPAFYTDVTDSYRLGRAGRIRTDLGGLYFNAVVVLLTFVWWWWTGWEALLLLVATQVLQMVQQLLPLLRFDGYHVLADLAGVPDLYHRIRPTLAGLLPHRWNAPENKVLKPRARAVITLWVLVTIPLMALMLWGVIAAVPRLVGSGDLVVREDVAAMTGAWRAGDGFGVGGHALQVLGVVLPALGCVLVLSRIGVRFFGGLTRWSHGSAGRRVVATLLSAAVVTTLSRAWWPHPGNYRPITPGDTGLVTALLPESSEGPSDLARPPTTIPAAAGALPAGTPVGAAAEQRLSNDQPLVATFDEGEELPTEDNPTLGIVLVPVPGTGADGQSGTPGPDASPPAEPWVFPFDQPLPPEEGDNQALAVNTTDDSVVYDVAFALVWAEENEVLNVNEAHAYASCTDCAAVAVAFQVVLIMDNAQVVVPQNLAVAANYDCTRCVTAALANQLVLSIQEAPGQEDLVALADLWSQLLEFANSITAYTLAEITEHLEAVQDQIVAILMDALPSPSTPSAPPPTTATGEDASGSPSAPHTTTPGQDASGSSSPAPTESPTPTPDGQPTTTTPSPTPEDTHTPSPSENPTPPPPTEEPSAPPSASPSG